MVRSLFAKEVRCKKPSRFDSCYFRMIQKMVGYSKQNIELLEDSLAVILKARDILSKPMPTIIVVDDDGKEVRRLEPPQRETLTYDDKIAYLRDAIALNKEFVKEFDETEE